MPLVLDIETVPLATAMDAPYPEDRQPPANYKSAETIARWREQDRVNWAEARAKECSLNPRLGRIHTLGFASCDDEGVRVHGGVLVAPTEADEAKLLTRFWSLVVDEAGYVVTWNGAWDLRFIVLRSIVHHVTPTVGSGIIKGWLRKYQTYPHFDCKAVLLNWDVRIAGEGLSEWADALNVPGKLEGLSGKDVYPLYLGGMHAEIAEYCAADVEATRRVFYKLAPYFGQPSQRLHADDVLMAEVP